MWEATNHCFSLTSMFLSLSLSLPLSLKKSINKSSSEDLKKPGWGLLCITELGIEGMV